MQWSDKIKAPYEVPFNLAEYVGVRVKLDADAKKLVHACTFQSAVYIVFRSNVPQYVGESGAVSTRFIAGVEKPEKGYVWQNSGGQFNVYFFEVPDNEAFRQAIEIEVMFLLRLYTGFWPIDSSRVNPFHQLKSDTLEINLASTRAREILEILFKLNPVFGNMSPEEVALLAAFDLTESGLGRR
jgi:hypothetical protein